MLEFMKNKIKTACLSQTNKEKGKAVSSPF
jgi:hypothetical protein